MELSRSDIRAILFYNFKRGLDQKSCKTEMDATLGTTAPSKSTISLWYNEFKRGRKSTEDEPRSGRPTSSVTQETIDAVRQIIEEDPHATYQHLQQMVGVASGTVKTILHDHLKFRKVCKRWVPHSLTDEQRKARVSWCKRMLRFYAKGKSRRTWEVLTGDETWIYYYDPRTKAQDRVWLAKGEPAPTKVRRERSTKKLMFSFFYEARPLELHDSPSRENRELLLLSETLPGSCIRGVLENSAEIRRSRHAFAPRQRVSAHCSRNGAVFAAETRQAGWPPTLFARSGAMRLLAVREAEGTVTWSQIFE